jgi:uncharacterized protein
MDTILTPLVGGLLIGLSSSIALGGLGRLTGISGIVASTLEKPRFENYWKYTFILGMIIGSLFMYHLYPNYFSYEFDYDYSKIILAGLLVGFGTRLGSGCTSGHGVCGLPRLSLRSLIATITFMLLGVITVALEGVL